MFNFFNKKITLDKNKKAKYPELTPEKEIEIKENEKLKIIKKFDLFSLFPEMEEETNILTKIIPYISIIINVIILILLLKK